MSEQHFTSGPFCDPNPDHHLAAFLTSLAQAGYAEKTRRDKARRIAPFIQWTRTTGIRPGRNRSNQDSPTLLAVVVDSGHHPGARV